MSFCSKVTTVSIIEPKSLHQNIRQILLPIDLKNVNDAVKSMTKDAEKSGFDWSLMFTFVANMTEIYEEMLVHPKFLPIKNEQFDLIVIGWFWNDFQIGLAAHFNVPAVIDVVANPSVFHRKYIGNPSGASYNPVEFLNFKGPMSFTERFINFIGVSAENLISYWADYYWHEPHYSKNFPSNKYPSFHDARKNISLVLMNNHFSQVECI